MFRSPVVWALAVQNMKPDINQVRYMLHNRTQDLLSLMEQESRYNIENGDNYPKNRDESYFFNLVTRYVWFVAKYGFNVKEARDGDKFYVAHPEYFEQWLSTGCVVLHQEELDAYFKNNPMV